MIFCSVCGADAESAQSGDAGSMSTTTKLGECYFHLDASTGIVSVCTRWAKLTDTTLHFCL